MTESLDTRVRLAAIDWLRGRMERYGDGPLPRSVLATGFEIDGQRVPLLGPQGIFKPRVCEFPLSITTAPRGPYDDRMEGEVLSYAYRGTDPQHRDNVGLRSAMMQGVPLVYLHGLSPGRYVATVPVYVVSDDPRALRFGVQVDDRIRTAPAPDRFAEDRDTARRGYITSTARASACPGRPTSGRILSVSNGATSDFAGLRSRRTPVRFSRRRVQFA